MRLFVKKNFLFLTVILIGAVVTLGVMEMGCTPKNQSDSATPAATSAAQSAASEQSRVLHLYCWASYFSPDFISAFENKFNVKVDLNYFSSNEELLAKLQAGARGYDLIVPSGYIVPALKSLGLIDPIGKLDWPELEKLIPRAKAPAYDPAHEYSVPYQWGTSGIAINRAKVKGKVDSWAWMFDHPELKGQLSMLDDAPAVVGVALKYLGYSFNEGSPAALAKVKELLMKQKSLLKSYTPDSQLVLLSGEVALAHAYSGDALQVGKKNPNIEYVLPKEGGEIFMDNFAIPKGAPSPQLAREFIRFSLDQKMAVNQVKHLFFSPVVNLAGVPGAEPLLAQKAVFPTDAQLKDYEMLVENPARIEAIQQLWVELKSN